MSAACFLCQGFLDYHAGAFRSGAENFRTGERRLRGETSGRAHEAATCRQFALVCLRLQGRLGELQQGFAESIADAERRGDRFTQAALTYHLAIAWLARDRAEEALSRMERTRWAPTSAGLHMQHWYEEQARGEIGLYTGRPREALERLSPFFNRLKRSYIARVRIHYCLARWLLGRLLLASAINGGENDRARVEQLASKLERERISFAKAWALLLRAAVFDQEGDLVRSVDVLRRAIDHGHAHDLPHVAAAARFRLGQILGDAEGGELVASARAWMASQEIKNPERMLEVWAPGFRGERSQSRAR